jgi:Tol biopolymer transport system component
MEDNQHGGTRLESWKEIAAYLKRDVRTVMRWEKSEGLPIHRQMHQARGNVFAYQSELEAWQASRVLRQTVSVPVTLRRRFATAAAFSLSMLLALVSLGSGPILDPAIASAQGIVNRQVWAPGDASGRMSPDGTVLTFTDWSTGDLAVRNLQTGQSRHVTNTGGWKSDEWAEHSAPSHDGKQIAYCWFKGMFELRVINTDGTGARTLIRNKSISYIQPLGWSLDGSHVFATIIPTNKIPKIVSVTVADGSMRILKILHHSPRDWSNLPRVAVSPDGEYMAYGDTQTDNPSHHDIFYLSADGSRQGPLVAHPADDYPLAWTPDGKTLLFSSDRSGEPSFWTLEVTDGKPQGAPQLLRPNTGDVTALGITPKGSFYYGMQVGIRDMYMASFDFETGELLKPPVTVTQSFTGRNTSADWSPDGSQIAFLSERETKEPGYGVHANTIVIHSLGSGGERELHPRLAAMGQNHKGLRWSSDGKALIVRGIDEKGHDGIFRVDAESGKVTTLLSGKVLGGVFRLARTRDNDVLAFTRNDPAGKFNSVRLRNLKTGAERAIVGGPSYGFINSFSISPDGKLLAFSAENVVRVMPIQGGKQREVLKIQAPEFLGWVAWTHDGRNILFVTQGQKRKCMVGTISASGGNPRYLDLKMNSIGGVRINPDNHRIVFEAGWASGEVWVMKNFLPTFRASK